MKQTLPLPHENELQLFERVQCTACIFNVFFYHHQLDMRRDVEKTEHKKPHQILTHAEVN